MGNCKSNNSHVHKQYFIVHWYRQVTGLALTFSVMMLFQMIRWHLLNESFTVKQTFNSSLITTLFEFRFQFIGTKIPVPVVAWCNLPHILELNNIQHNAWLMRSMLRNIYRAIFRILWTSNNFPGPFPFKDFKCMHQRLLLCHNKVTSCPFG